jgi:hypothetical protein
VTLGGGTGSVLHPGDPLGVPAGPMVRRAERPGEAVPERPREVAAVYEVHRLEIQRVAEAVLITGRLREGFGLFAHGTHPPELAKRHQCGPEVEADVEGVGDRAGLLRQPLQRVERLLEAGGRLAVGRAQEGLGAGLA